MNLPSIKSHIPFPDTQKQELATSGKAYTRKKEAEKVFYRHKASYIQSDSLFLQTEFKEVENKKRTKFL